MGFNLPCESVDYPDLLKGRQKGPYPTESVCITYTLSRIASSVRAALGPSDPFSHIPLQMGRTALINGSLTTLSRELHLES
jgi:hypothetical protein